MTAQPSASAAHPHRRRLPRSAHCRPCPSTCPPHSPWSLQDNPAWYIADPICTFLFAALVLWTTRAILRDISDVLMERVPRGLCIKTINDDLSRVAGVDEVHDLHVWSLTPGAPCASSPLPPHGSCRSPGVLAAAQLPGLPAASPAANAASPRASRASLLCPRSHRFHPRPAVAGIPLLCAHVSLSAEADPTGVLVELTSYSRGIGITHSTFQLFVSGSTCPCDC